jgi:hypothetical protein
MNAQENYINVATIWLFFLQNILWSFECFLRSDKNVLKRIVISKFKKENCFNIIMKERGWIRICFSLVGLVLVIVEIVVAVLLDQRLQVVLDGGVAFLQSKLSKNASRSLALMKIFKKKINYILHSSKMPFKF